jgi:hypothetical protein
VFVEAVGYLLPACECGTGLIDHNNIESGQQRLLLAKRLSNNSLNTVACRRATTMLLGDCQTQPTIARFIASTQHGEQFIAASRRSIEHAAECRSIK